jgi:hypothetical protein
MSKVSCEFVYVVDAPGSALSVLAVYGLDEQSSWSHTEYEGILAGVTTTDREKERKAFY